MELFKCKSEKEKNIKNIYDEILRLSEQINTVKEKVEKEYPLFDSLNKINEEIEGLKKKTTELENYKAYAESISKQIEVLKTVKESHSKWPLCLSIGVVLLFFGFSVFFVWSLFFSTTFVEANNSIPMLIVGAIIYFVMAIILVLFAYQNMNVFNCKEKNNNKK